MLSRIQRRLTDLYDLDVEVSVEDFLCGEDVVRAAVGDGVARGEVLLVAEEPDGVSVGLYVDPAAVAALETHRGPDAWDSCFAASCLATEGVSHFLYLAFRATNEEAVSQLELELQAEVDKYATALLRGHSPDVLSGNGASLVRELAMLERSQRLRRRLFRDVAYLDAAATTEGARYRRANRIASEFTAHLERAHVACGDLGGLSSALRRFYRMGMRGKTEAASGENR